MRRLCSVLLVLAVTASARGHFVWLLPGEPGAKKLTARAVFSDTLAPDDAELLKKVAHTKFYALDVDSKAAPFKARAGKGALELDVPGDKTRAVLAVCPYGVVAKGKKPFLLNYYAKTFVGPLSGPGLALPAPRSVPLDVIVVRTGKDEQAARVLWDRRPLAGAEVVLTVPGKDETVTRKTDKRGLVPLEVAKKGGLYGIRAAHVEDKAGTEGGSKYFEVRHYATLTFPVTLEKTSGATADEGDEPKADPEATKLLADARAARATWKDFPGFTADVTVNVDGKATAGKLEVGPKGKVALKLEGDAAGWARRTLESVVGHRLDDSAALKTPCAFTDKVTDHPLGREIRVLNDEFHSSYRIRDRQVIVVNRTTGPVRFTITVAENRLSAEKKFLPAHYVVNTWDVKTGALKSSAAHHQTWVRVGGFDLPATAAVVTAGTGSLEARTIKLSNHRLLGERKAE